MQVPSEELPERPATVPEGAVWIADLDKWELAETGPGGEKSGPYEMWRPDGSFYLRGRYAAGVADGPFSLYHPNGQVARQGRYQAGELDGTVIAYASDAETTEALRGCCVPAGAWQMQARWAEGRLMRETFFDREGRTLLSDGSPQPERPASVPESAEFLEWERRWAVGGYDPEKGSEGAWRYFDEEGRLAEEAEYREGKKVSSRLHDGAGAVRQEASFVGDGIRDGQWRRRFSAEESPYADDRLREERGAYDNGQKKGRWTLLDGDGAVVRTVEYGRAWREGETAEVLADGTRTAAEWTAHGRALLAEGRAREAVCAMARAAAAAGSAGPLREYLAETTVPLGETENARLLGELSESTDESPKAALGALVGGAEPATVLRTLASLLKGANRAARDLAEAAILLAPDRPMAYLTRALIRIELGDPEGARADAAVVVRESSDTAEFLGNYVRLLFPEFGFTPRREIPHSPLPDMPDAPAQPLDAVRRAIQVYATRLGLVRDSLVGMVGEAPWLPPDVATLLPEGPLALRAETAEITDETEEGSQTSEVRIDEALATSGLGVPSLMRMARSQWAGLCWLCWSAGLEEVALPSALSPPANFAQAAGMAIARFWRAQDAVITGGLRSMTAGVEGFVWEDMEIDGMPKLFAEMACDEYLEMRSVFLFLSSPENLSPFQSDLRAA